jgi:hypothetical protein
VRTTAALITNMATTVSVAGLPKPAKASAGVSQPASTASSTATSASSSKGSGFKKFQARGENNAISILVLISVGFSCFVSRLVKLVSKIARCNRLNHPPSGAHGRLWCSVCATL